MELADRRLRERAHGVEVGSAIAGTDAGDHGGVQIGDVVEPIERPIVDARCLLGACDDRLVGQQIEVDPGPQLTDPLSTLDPVIGPVLDHRDVVDTEQPGHDRRAFPRPHRQVLPDDRRLDLSVQGNCRQHVLDAGATQDSVLDLVAGLTQRSQLSFEAFGGGDRRVVGQHHRIELLLRSTSNEFLLLQRLVLVEQRRTIAVLLQQPGRERGLLRQFGGVHRIEVLPEPVQSVQSRVQPEALVRRQPVQLTAYPILFQRGVQTGMVDSGELLGRIIEQVPDVDPLRGGVRHRGQSGDLEARRALAVRGQR